ncbi:NMD3-related protein [archaeon]
MKDRFCPKCGETSKSFYKGFCIDCFLADHPGLVEIEGMAIKRCQRCLRVKSRGEWESGGSASMKEIVRSHVKTLLDDAEISVERAEQSQTAEVYDVTVKGTLGGEEVTITKPFTVKYAKQICEVCSRKSGDYYEAIIQLRPKEKVVDLNRLKTALIFLRNEAHALVKKDRKAEIFRYELVKNGIDIYFGSKRAAKISLQHLQATYRPVVKESYTLRGVNKETGKNRYSVTYSVRL